MAEQKFITDMNRRERERFTAALVGISNDAVVAAQALREENDQAIVGPLLMLTFRMQVLGELLRVLQEAQTVDMSDLDYPEARPE